MSIFGDIGDFIGDNIKPITGLVTGLGGAYMNNRNQDAYLDSLRNAEQRNYDESKAYYDAYTNYLGQKNAAGAASRASSASAARANQAAGMAAGKKALKQEKKGFKQLKDIWSPYMETGKQILPMMANNYGMGSGNLSRMNEVFKGTDFQNKLKQSIPSYQVDVPIPDFLLGKGA